MRYGTDKHTYELIENWAILPEGWAFEDVCDISIDAQDRVYVINRSEHPVMVFDREGNLLNSWGEGFFKRAHGSRILPDETIFCTDDLNHTVTRFTLAGKLLMTLGVAGEASDTGYTHKSSMYESIATISRGGPPFNRPTGAAVNSAGEIYISDGYGNARVHKFSPQGELLFSWGEPGNGPGQFRLPHSVWVDKQECVWVTDWQNNRIQIFDAQGRFLAEWTDLIGPSDVFIDDEETVYVSEEERRLSIFSIDGRLLARWHSQGQATETALFIAPHAVAVDSHGDLYVGEVSKTFAGVDKGLRTLQKFARCN